MDNIKTKLKEVLSIEDLDITEKTTIKDVLNTYNSREDTTIKDAIENMSFESYSSPYPIVHVLQRYANSKYSYQPFKYEPGTIEQSLSDDVKIIVMLYNLNSSGKMYWLKTTLCTLFNINIDGSDVLFSSWGSNTDSGSPGLFLTFEDGSAYRVIENAEYTEAYFEAFLPETESQQSIAKGAAPMLKATYGVRFDGTDSSTIHPVVFKMGYRSVTHGPYLTPLHPMTSGDSTFTKRTIVEISKYSATDYRCKMRNDGDLAITIEPGNKITAFGLSLAVEDKYMFPHPDVSEWPVPEAN